MYTREAKLVSSTNLDLVEVQSDVSTVSSVYSIVSVNDLEEVLSSFDYTLINSFIDTPYGIAEKYSVINFPLQQHLEDLVESLNDLTPNFNLMFS